MTRWRGLCKDNGGGKEEVELFPFVIKLMKGSYYKLYFVPLI